MGTGDMRCNSCGQEWDACRCKSLGEVAAEGYLKRAKAHFLGHTMDVNDWAMVIDSAYVMTKYGLSDRDLMKFADAVGKTGRKRAMEILLEV